MNLIVNVCYPSDKWIINLLIFMICMSGEGTIENYLGSNQTSHPRKGTCRGVVNYIGNHKDVNFVAS